MSVQTLQYASPPSASQRHRWLILAAISITLLLFIVRIRQRPAPPATLSPTPAQLSLARNDAADLRMALLCFEADNGQIPSQASLATSLVSQPAGMFLWQGPYLPSLPVDPWNKAYIYKVTPLPDGLDVTVFSAGPDGLPGTPDDVLPRRGSCGTGESAILQIRRGRREILCSSMTGFLRECVAIPWSFLRGDNSETEFHWLIARHFLWSANRAVELRSAPLVDNTASAIPVQPSR
jgi:general secretion pathway protein G